MTSKSTRTTGNPVSANLFYADGSSRFVSAMRPEDSALKFLKNDASLVSVSVGNDKTGWIKIDRDQIDWTKV